LVQVSRVENVFQIMYLMRVWCLSPLSRVINKKQKTKNTLRLMEISGVAGLLPGAAGLPGCCRGAAGVLPGCCRGAAGCCRVLPGAAG
jgi:hypothetical protein